MAKLAGLEVRIAKVEQEGGGHAVRGGDPVQGGGLGESAGFVQAVGLLELRLTGRARAGQEQDAGEQAKRLAKPDPGLVRATARVHLRARNNSLSRARWAFISPVVCEPA